MQSHLAGFTVYTLAMMGVIFIAFLVVKNSLNFGNKNKTNQFLNLEQTLNLTPKKSIHVIKAGNERFLISSDDAGTSFLAKLEDQTQEPNDEISSVEEELQNEIVNIQAHKKMSQNLDQNSVMKRILTKLGS